MSMDHFNQNFDMKNISFDKKTWFNLYDSIIRLSVAKFVQKNPHFFSK